MCACLLAEDNMRLLIVGGMLVLAVSASVTPANAGGGFCGNYGIQGIYCPCSGQCWADAFRRHVISMTVFDDKQLQACLSKCVNAAQAAQRWSPRASDMSTVVGSFTTK
jgi:hypothetical protein